MAQKIVRSAKSGRFVKKSKAKSSPNTTVTETIGKKKKKVPKKNLMRHTPGTKKSK